MQEVSFAASLNKRFAPIVARPVDLADVPELLKQFQFIFFDDETKFEETADKLVEALAVDIEWIRKHTEIGELARRWALAGRPGPRGLLLRSPALEEAEQWIAARPQDAPAPTEETQALIRDSRKAATRRRNVLSASLSAGLLLALGLAGLTYWQRQLAVTQRDRALITQSRFLADLSRQHSERGDHATAALLALEVLPHRKDTPERPLAPQAEDALYHSLATQRERVLLFAQASKIESLRVSSDARRLLTKQEDRSLSVWDANDYRLLATHGPLGEDLVSARFNLAGDRILLYRKDKSLEAIYAVSGQKAEVSALEAGVLLPYLTGQFAAVTPDWRIAVILKPVAVATFDPETGLHRSSIPLKGEETKPDQEYRISSDGSRILSVVNGRGILWDAATGEITGRIEDLDFHVYFDFDPSGTKVIWHRYASAFVYDIETQERREFAHPESKSIKGHERDQATVNASAVLPGGNWMVTASADKTVRIWGVENGQSVMTLEGHQGAVRTVFPLPDSRLVTQSEDGTVQIWATVEQEIRPPHSFTTRLSVRSTGRAPFGWFQSKRTVRLPCGTTRTTRCSLR